MLFCSKAHAPRTTFAPTWAVVDTHRALGRVHTEDPLPLARGKKIRA